MSEVLQHTSDKQSAVTFSEAAQQHLMVCLKENAQACGLRLSVKKSGCSGFSYVVDFVVQPISGDLVFSGFEPYDLYIEKSSYPFLKGVHVDYVHQGLSSKLVFNNPNQTGLCGCGESFTVN